MTEGRHDDLWTEPGRSVEEGRIVYAWPPEGRFHDLWNEFDARFEDDAKSDLFHLLKNWIDAGSRTLCWTCGLVINPGDGRTKDNMLVHHLCPAPPPVADR